MTLHKVLHYPNPRLRIKAKPVEQFDEELQRLINDMFETMYENHGGGLAATQIDVHVQIFIADPSGDKQDQWVFINPEIIEIRGEKVYEEGCLSVPDIFEKVKRAEYVKIKAKNRHGAEFTIEASGDYLANCVQHEMDHLQGKVFVDHLSPLKQRRIRKKIEKLKKQIL